jgi:hypothetical protein
MRLGSLLIFLFLAACGGGSGGGLDLIDLPLFDAADFPGGPVDNPYFPLPVGRVLTYEADTPEGLEVIVVEVLPDVKVVLGVTCVVVRDTVTLDGELIEDTFDWYAQDIDGNVWYMGEDSTEYEGGIPVSKAGSWEAGVDGAAAGILMWGTFPPAGTSYRQEFYEGEAEDVGTILATDETVVVPWGTFAPCLKTADTTPLEPDAYEEKFYAPGIGTVLEVDDEDVRTELVDVEDAP